MLLLNISVLEQCFLLLLRMRSMHLGTIRETLISLGRRLLNQRYFCSVYGYAGKEDLRKGHKTQKKKIEGNYTFFRDNYV